jgi:hypothetical protein
MENQRLRIAFWFGLLILLRGLTSSEWVLVAAGAVALTWCAASVYLRRREQSSQQRTGDHWRSSRRYNTSQT